jgi:hypothetical protein
MERSDDIEALDKERERLESIREAMLMQRVADSAPSDASARSIRQELAPINARIANLDRQRLQAMSAAELSASGDRLQQMLEGKSNDEIRRDRRLSDAVFDLGAIDAELRRRGHSRRHPETAGPLPSLNVWLNVAMAGLLGLAALWMGHQQANTGDGALGLGLLLLSAAIYFHQHPTRSSRTGTALCVFPSLILIVIGCVIR